MRTTLRDLSASLGVDADIVALHAADLDDATPWYVTALAGFGTWIGAMLMAIALALTRAFESDGARMALGVVLLVIAPVIARASHRPAATQAALIGVVGGQVLFFSGFDAGSLSVRLAIGLLVELYVIAAVNRPLTRAMATLAALGTVLFLLHDSRLQVDVVPLVAGALGVAGFLGERRVLDRRWSAVVRPVATACIVGWLGFWTFEAMAANFHLVRSPFSVALPPLHAVAGAAAIIATAVTAGARGRSLVGVGLVALVAAWLSLSLPGFVAALVVVVVGVVVRARLLTGVAVAFVLFFLWLTYWRLDVTLLEKALWSTATGVLLFVVRAAVGGRSGAPLPSFGGRRAALGRRDALLAMGGAALFVVVLGGSILSRERVLGRGRRVLLPLRPRDPRSLAQGDFMALRTELAVDVERAVTAVSAGATSPRFVVVNVDGNDVGTYARIEPDATAALAPNQARLKLHGTPPVRVGAEELFFPEGSAARFADARYGDVRVDADGDVVLVGLCGADRAPL